MKILYIATSFPKESKGATIYTDLAEALNQKGHEITVAVSEQKRNQSATTLETERGFKVLRAVVGDYYDVNIIKKGIVTVLLPFIMKKEIKKHLGKEKFDMVLFETPPITNAGVVAWAKKQFKCKSYLMLKDIFPQNGLDLGMLGSGIIGKVIFNYFKYKEKLLYKTADVIGCMSEGNKKYLLEHNPEISEKKVEIFPNAKKITEDYVCKEYVVRQKLGIPENACVFLFGGNMGKPQYVEILASAANEFKNDENIWFLFVGRGTEKPILAKAIEANNIKNALLLDNLPREEYEQLTKESDVGLITLDPRFTIPNYPSRILSYMDYAKPVLAATDTVTDMKELIEEADCGEWVCSADKEAFYKKIKELSADKEKRCRQGENGRSYMKEHFTVDRCVEILERADIV